jgi:thiol-disulfide isomerase/thioredoxin
MKKRFQTKRIKRSIKLERSKSSKKNKVVKYRKMSRKNGGTRKFTHFKSNFPTRPTSPPNSEFNWENINEEILPFDSNKKYEVLKDTFNKTVSDGNFDKIIIYGKFWMKGCGYCDAIKDIWDKLVKEIKTEYSTQFYNADFRQENIEEAKQVLKEKTNVNDIPINGFPTIYLIKNGKVNIYENEKEGRTHKAMKEWIISFLK